jgi:hypothetical protein
MTLSIFGGDEDGGVGGPNGFTAERGGSNATAAALSAARSMTLCAHRNKRPRALCRFKRTAGPDRIFMAAPNKQN